ncbi:hypothetical protein [Streptomyces sp. A1136]|uniref:hypothetical protein n=1 Tax=Streptomyces sp. A1136 TaxID=2563102 RepID=UPI00109E6D18|nr:hypothetical protein [Streptomyces sp. A1136]THA50598.1 hypothetical protein E6R62_24810 [Streptomyces sp. A1136]
MPKFAENDEEANQSLLDYCESTGFDPEWISPDEWATTIRIARTKDKGYVEAYKTIDTDRTEMIKAGARDARQKKVDNDAAGLLGRLATHYSLKDSLAVTVLKQCRSAYVGGERVNLGLGGSPMDPSAYEELREEWKAVAALAAGGIYTEFHSFPPQNKAALGKGNVGGTLAKRKVQGNLLVKVAGVRFNMHIDIDD